MIMRRAHHGNSQQGTLPFIVIINLGNRDIEVVFDARRNAFQYLSLTLEGSRLWQMELNGAYTHNHGRQCLGNRRRSELRSDFFEHKGFNRVHPSFMS